MPPLVIAHRGSSETEPEHTLAAYRRAIAEGADGVECDVRLTADHHLVCVHDRLVNRTSSGRGVVSTFELERLEGMDWGSWKAAHPDAREVPDTRGEGDRRQLLTLRRLLAAVVEVDRPLTVLVETKHPTRWGGLVERHVAKVLREFGLDRGPDAVGHRVEVMSFSRAAVQRMVQLCPEVAAVHLMEHPLHVRLRDGVLPPGVRRVGVDIGIVRRWPEVVERHHRRGNRVYVWTVDDPADVDLCLRLGVEAIITNRPYATIDRVKSPR